MFFALEAPLLDVNVGGTYWDCYNITVPLAEKKRVQISDSQQLNKSSDYI